MRPNCRRLREDVNNRRKTHRRQPSVTAAWCLVLSTLACNLLFAAFVGRANGQVFERSSQLPPAEVEQLDASSAAHLENAKRFLGQQQWGEAVESIRRVQEAEPSRLVKVELTQPIPGFELYIRASEYCQRRLASLADEAPEALAHYRRLVDALAESWLREGEKTNNESLLRRVVEQTFASQAGDDALLKLGDLALARGDFTAARGDWQPYRRYVHGSTCRGQCLASQGRNAPFAGTASVRLRSSWT